MMTQLTALRNDPCGLETPCQIGCRLLNCFPFAAQANRYDLLSNLKADMFIPIGKGRDLEMFSCGDDEDDKAIGR